MKTLWIILGAVVATFVLGIGGALVVIYSGIYDIAASRQHPALVYAMLGWARDRSVAHHARDIAVPADFADLALDRGFDLYETECRHCHGGPGVAPGDFALGMMPVPSNLVAAGRELDPASIYWIAKNGIKMTGMPAWEYRLSEDDLWAIVAFVKAMPTLSGPEYRAMVAARQANAGAALLAAAAGARDAGETASAGPGDPAAGRRMIIQYGCTSCHVIPGFSGADIHVGPDLGGIGSRRYIAGVLINTPDNMARWLVDPPAVDPLSAMPALGIDPEQARDIAAFLETLDEDRG